MKRRGSRGTIEDRLEVGGGGGVRVRGGKVVFSSSQQEATTTTPTTTTSLPSWNQQQQQQPPGHIYDNDDYDDNGSNGSNNSKEKHHHYGKYGWWWLSSLLLLSNNNKRRNNNINGIIKTRLLLLIQKCRRGSEIIINNNIMKMIDRHCRGRKGVGSPPRVSIVVIIFLLMIMITIICFTRILRTPVSGKNEFSLLLLNLISVNNNTSTSTTIVPKPISKIPSDDEDLLAVIDPSLSAGGFNNTNTNINNDTSSSIAKWYYYAYDDDYQRNPLINFDDDIFIKENNPKTKYCRRTNWHRNLPIDCNKLHEFDILNKFIYGSMYYLTTGGYREVYLTNITGYESSESMNNNNNDNNNNNKVAFKSIMWDTPEFKYDVDEMRTDAIISEKISSSNPNRIVDMYGYCGSSSINEAMMHGDLYDLAKSQIIQIQKKKDQQKHHDRSDEGGGDFDGDDDQKNKRPRPVTIILSGKQKLQLALEMAESIEILHSYKGGVIVHDDLKLPQFMITKKQKKRQKPGNNNNNKNDENDDDDDDVEYGVKLNDFNRAEIMLFDTINNEYCPYRNDRAGGNWRAPEEYQIKALDEKIDVYSLGSSYYALMTGHKPFDNNMYKSTKLSDKDIKKKLRKGENDYLDPRYCNNDTTSSSGYGDRKMCEIIKLCWEVDPTKRIDIFGVVKFLRDAIKYQKQEEQR